MAASVRMPMTMSSQRRPIRGDPPVEPAVDDRRQDARRDRGDADEEHPSPGVLEDERRVEGGDAADGGDGEGERERRVPARGPEDEPREGRQVSLGGSHR
jgi:hypothetical protein